MVTVSRDFMYLNMSDFMINRDTVMPFALGSKIRADKVSDFLVVMLSKSRDLGDFSRT